MEISCLSTSLCFEYIKKRLANSLTVATYPPNRDISLSITDLNDDCLEEIFMNLNLNHLFNVTVTHRRFLNACRRVFYKKYKNNEITISVYQTIQPQYVDVLCLLGDMIAHLRVTFDRFDDFGNFNNRIHTAIVQHCSETLTEITFNHILPTMEINKPFQNLEKLNFNHGCVGRTMSEFKMWFPKLQSIQFFFCETLNTNCIERNFPTLEHFTVAHHNFTFQNLQIFLDLNPQLKSFTVYNYDRSLISRLQKYTEFKFRSLRTTFETYPCYFSFNNGKFWPPIKSLHID